MGNEEMHKIFVYDNLCLGFADSIDYLQAKHGCEWCGFADFRGEYRLWYTGKVYLTPFPGGKGCAGEVYNVPDSVLSRLDKKYQHGYNKTESFERIKIMVEMGDDTPVEAWCYVYDISKLQARRLKSKTIYDYKAMSPTLSGKNGHQPKLCC
ncbi:MAG: gamma-glutamylcyclotransferase family protein [Candidatus Caenarcaniphilales bacterium]|nr:gamma-glutamylcyclotransferase family protein [Candidatus Caenarcaniphilales bacterium]